MSEAELGGTFLRSSLERAGPDGKLLRIRMRPRTCGFAQNDNARRSLIRSGSIVLEHPHPTFGRMGRRFGFGASICTGAGKLQVVRFSQNDETKSDSGQRLLAIELGGVARGEEDGDGEHGRWLRWRRRDRRAALWPKMVRRGCAGARGCRR